MSAPLRAPFPYAGGKSRAAALVWEALGDPAHYVEPFCGSAAVLLARDVEGERTETLNDASGFVVNFYRAVQHDAAAVAKHCSWPVSELDLVARHRWLVAQTAELEAALAADPEHFDAKVAGWWAWGAALWLGDEWCGRLTPPRQLPVLSAVGPGVHRRSLGRAHAGVGAERLEHTSVAEWLQAIGHRLRRVRLACGDWTRVLSNAVLFGPLDCGCRLDARGEHVGVFLDAPYVAGKIRYTKGDAAQLQPAVAAWCRSVERDPRVRVVVAGEEGEYDLPGWEQVQWSRKGGGGAAGGARQHAERLWLSPQCARATAQGSLFAAEGGR